MNMEQFVMELINCFNNRHRADMNNLLSDVPENIEMTHVLFKILPWLRLEYKRYEWQKTKPYTKSKPLKLYPQYKWGSDIIWLVENNELFSRYFQITEDKLYINPNISEEEKQKALLAVSENYVPKLIR